MVTLFTPFFYQMIDVAEGSTVNIDVQGKRVAFR